jgi:hypothetical protein
LSSSYACNWNVQRKNNARGLHFSHQCFVLTRWGSRYCTVTLHSAVCHPGTFPQYGVEPGSRCRTADCSKSHSRKTYYSTVKEPGTGGKCTPIDYCTEIKDLIDLCLKLPPKCKSIRPLRKYGMTTFIGHVRNFLDRGGTGRLT